MDQLDWSKKQEGYKSADWSSKPSLFAEFSFKYFPENGLVLELGAGVGQDSVFFAKNGLNVTSTDKTVGHLCATVDRLDTHTKQLINVQKLDLTEPFAIEDSSFDVVYAHLSLHYFDKATTQKIFTEIHRVLKPNGILAFFTNSVNDPEYDTGAQIEKDYFSTGGDTKRYFSVDTALGFASSFEPMIADAQGETYKDMAKGVHGLIRFVGSKTDLS